MSRAYRIQVKESVKHVVRASDHVGTQLELLEILPPERMTDLLAQELQKRGFKKQGDKLIRRASDGVTVEVDAAASVTVTASTEQKLTLEAERKGWSAVERGKEHEQAQENLRQEALKEMQRQAEQKKAQLQKQMTDRLEGHLTDLCRELDQAVNRVTADALKEKAAQIGHVKAMSEDAQTGSLTIVLEV